jgi:adenylylsulfate kinase
MDEKNRNLYWREPSVTVTDRWKRYGYMTRAIWFSDLSASGKSTLANALCKEFHMS